MEKVSTGQLEDVVFVTLVYCYPLTYFLEVQFCKTLVWFVKAEEPASSLSICWCIRLAFYGAPVEKPAPTPSSSNRSLHQNTRFEAQLSLFHNVSERMQSVGVCLYPVRWLGLVTEPPETVFLGHPCF